MKMKVTNWIYAKLCLILTIRTLDISKQWMGEKKLQFDSLYKMHLQHCTVLFNNVNILVYLYSCGCSPVVDCLSTRPWSWYLASQKKKTRDLCWFSSLLIFVAITQYTKEECNAVALQERYRSLPFIYEHILPKIYLKYILSKNYILLW